jgi:LuxR family maltose regulon positive regulatory protein
VGRCKKAARLVVAFYPDETDVRRAFAHVNLGEILYYAGELDSAAACLEEATRRLADAEPSTVVTQMLLHGHGHLAAVRADLGELDQAERSAAEVERMIRGARQEESPWGMLVHVARGKLLELRGDLASAETALGRAEVHARRISWPLELAHVLLVLARLKHRVRKHDEARSLAREVREVLRSCPDPGVLRDLLARTERSLQLAPRPPGPPLALDVELSERELTVLRLLAGDLSQREIGSELYVSFNTVKAHVKSIFRKLGVSRRADAVARARELGLL